MAVLVSLNTTWDCGSVQLLAHRVLGVVKTARPPLRRAPCPPMPGWPLAETAGSPCSPGMISARRAQHSEAADHTDRPGGRETA